ncbi:MAG: site-2 protease family protein [Cytophagaceae bacterium]
MKWSITIGRFFGIRVLIHWTFLLLLAWIGYSVFKRSSDINETIITIGFILSIFLCVLLHEFGHALTARKYGIGTRKITLLPIGGVASIEKIPEDPKQELWITVAGPAVNLAIAIILFLIAPVKENMTDPELQGISSQTFLTSLFWVNVILVIFNAIPAFPMDGGRILRSLLAMKMGRYKATKIASNLGQIIAIGFFIVGLFYNPFLMFIAVFVFFGAYAENMGVQNMEFLSGYTVQDAMMTNLTLLSPENTLKDAADKLLEGSEQNFIIYSDNAVIGIITRPILIDSLKTHQINTPLHQIMNRRYITFQATDSLMNVYTALQQDPKNFFPVIYNGKLAGAINFENINEFIMIRSALH